MRNITYLLLFFLPFISIAQTFVGQPIYTESQRQEMKSRFVNGPYKSRTTGSFGAYDGTFDKILAQKNNFMADPNAGDWDFAVVGDDQLNKLPDQNTSNPTPQANENIEDMHSAAIWAFLHYDDPNSEIAAEAIVVAAEVCKEIYDRARDPLLDTSNRTRYNPSSFATNPHLFYVGKFTKYLSDYALLRSVGIDGLTAAERSEVDNWFKDADEFWGGKIDFDTKSRFGNDWKDEIYGSSSWNNPIRDGSSRTNPIFTDDSGQANSDYMVSEKMSGFWNVGYDYMMFRALYGIVYNVQSAKNHAFAYYRDTFKFAVFSDGTFAEMIRATSSKEDWGVFYGTVTFGAMVKLALWHAIGVENGLVGMGDKGKYFNYSTSLGIDSYPSLSEHGGSPTSGGQKDLLLVAKAWSKFYAQANGTMLGWQPQRFNSVTSGIELIEGGNNFHYISPAAAMNAWYKDPEISDWYKGLGSFPPIKDGKSGAQSIAGSWSAGQGNANEYHGVGMWFDMEDIMFSGETDTSNRCPSVVSTVGNTLELELNDTYTEEGGTWTDREDGSGIADIGGDSVDTSKSGNYYVTYSYTDTNGCIGSTTLTVNVKDPNNDCPEVKSNGGNSLIINLSVGDSYTEQGGTWTDTEDGSGIATVGGDTVNTSQEGTYIVVYSYTDTNNCTASASLTVNVEALSEEILIESFSWDNEREIRTVGDFFLPARTIIPANPDLPYFWVLVSDETILDVNHNGVLTALKPGIVTVTGRTLDGTDLSDTIIIEVVPNPDQILIESFSWDNEREIRTVGDFFLPARTIIPANPDLPHFWVLVSDETILDVNHNGVLTALKPGIVTVTGRTLDGTDLSDTIVIEVVAPSGPLPSLNIQNASASEGENLTFVATLSNSSSEEITLDLEYSNETADNQDYLPTSTQISFAPGETEKTVIVETTDDSNAEEDETFILEVRVEEPGKLANTSIEVIGTILNNDILKKLKIFPNPATSGSQISIGGLDEGTYQISLYNLSGQVVGSTMIDHNGSLYEYTLPSVGRGLYILSVINASTKESGKILIQ